MLVITRTPGEKIKLSNGVIISIEGLTPSRVKVGIEAPQAISISRSSPCKICGVPCFDFYLGYKDIPICGSPRCMQRIKQSHQKEPSCEQS